jgi:serine kinase of HPr protein (carbohydrate metabolism regulator)
METRLTLRPGQPGTRKLVEKYGERLIRVRYVYDAEGRRRLKTVELVVEAVPWRPNPRKPRRQDDDIVYVRIAYHETELRERAKRLGAIWRHPQRLWEITFQDSKRLGIADRIVEGG